MVIGLERGVDCLHMVQLMPLPSQNHISLASFQSRLVLPFWYQLTQVVLENRPLNECNSICCPTNRMPTTNPQHRISLNATDID